MQRNLNYFRFFIISFNKFKDNYIYVFFLCKKKYFSWILGKIFCLLYAVCKLVTLVTLPEIINNILYLWFPVISM